MTFGGSGIKGITNVLPGHQPLPSPSSPQPNILWADEELNFKCPTAVSICWPLLVVGRLIKLTPQSNQIKIKIARICHSLRERAARR